MAPHDAATDKRHNLYKNDFGAFYPTGHIVVAFEQRDEAQQVCDQLRNDGYKEDECDLYSAEEVAHGAQENIDNTGWMARLGKSIAAVKRHLDVAKGGATFLIVRVAKDEDADHVMDAVRQKSFVLAHRYHKLAIEDLNADDGHTRATSPR